MSLYVQLTSGHTCLVCVAVRQAHEQTIRDRLEATRARLRSIKHRVAGRHEPPAACLDLRVPLHYLPAKLEAVKRRRREGKRGRSIGSGHVVVEVEPSLQRSALALQHKAYPNMHWS
jgi:hypothetical protein